MRSFVAMVTALLLITDAAQAQPTEAELRAFPVPPAKGWDAVSVMNGQTTQWYGYLVRPTKSHPTGDSTQPQEFSWVLYAGDGIRNGKTGVFWGDWGTYAVPPPGPPDPMTGEIPDGCFHTHVTYGVWGRQRTTQAQILPWGTTVSVRWVYLGGGGKSGVRTADGQCAHSVDNSLKQFGAEFGWGVDMLTVDLKPFCTWFRCVTYDFIALAVLNASHGVGDCGAFACTEPGWELGYTVP